VALDFLVIKRDYFQTETLPKFQTDAVPLTRGALRLRTLTVIKRNNRRNQQNLSIPFPASRYNDLTTHEPYNRLYHQKNRRKMRIKTITNGGCILPGEAVELRLDMFADRSGLWHWHIIRAAKYSRPIDFTLDMPHYWAARWENGEDEVEVNIRKLHHLNDRCSHLFKRACENFKVRTEANSLYTEFFGESSTAANDLNVIIDDLLLQDWTIPSL